MEQIVTRLLEDFENGKMSRRQLIQGLTVAAAATAASVPAIAAEDKVLRATYINHVSYQVTDYAKSRDFYVNLFGMKVSEDDGKTQCRLSFGDNILIVRTRASKTPPPLVDHIAYTIADWDTEKDRVADELKRRGIKIERGDAKSSFHILDPDGFEVQFGGLRQ